MIRYSVVQYPHVFRLRVHLDTSEELSLVLCGHFCRNPSHDACCVCLRERERDFEPRVCSLHREEWRRRGWSMP